MDFTSGQICKTMCKVEQTIWKELRTEPLNLHTVHDMMTGRGDQLLHAAVVDRTIKEDNENLS